MHQHVGLPVLERGQERNRIILDQRPVAAAPSQRIAVPSKHVAIPSKRVALAPAARGPARDENFQALKQAHTANEVAVFQGQRQNPCRKNRFHNRARLKFAIEISGARPLASANDFVRETPQGKPPRHIAPARRIFQGERRPIAPECRSADNIVGA